MTYPELMTISSNCGDKTQAFWWPPPQVQAALICGVQCYSGIVIKKDIALMVYVSVAGFPFRNATVNLWSRINSDKDIKLIKTETF